MIDDLAELAAAAATDVAIENAAKRHRWARIIRAIIGLSFIGAIAVAIFITFKYS